jgi:transaldolase
MPFDGGDAEAVPREFARGLYDDALVADLQGSGTAAFARSWGDLMERR